MAKSIFREKEMQPGEERLHGALGGAWPLWRALEAYLAEAFPGADSLWKYYGKAWGWSLVYQRKGKALCYLSPGEGGFIVSMSFSDKGREAIRQTDLPEALQEAVETAQYNPAGRMFDLDVGSEAALTVAQRLVDIKGRT